MKRNETSLVFYFTLVIAAAVLFALPATGVADMHNKDTSQEMKQGVKEAAQDTKEAAKEAWDETKEAAHETADKTKEMANEATEETKDFTAEAEHEIDQAINAFQRASDADRRIPSEVIQNAKAVAIFPEVTKAGFMVGGRYGNGVLMFNQKDGWNGPLFVDLYGASVGAQLGVEQTDLFMVFNTDKGLESLRGGKVTLGAETSVAAGEWGKKAGVNTRADVIVYKQTQGLFAGASLTGAVIQIDEESNNRFYNKEGQARTYFGSEEIFRDKKVPRTKATDDLVILLRDY